MNNFCATSVDVWKFIGEVVYVIKIFIPAIIILLGTLDLGKAVLAGDEKSIKEAQKTFIKRLIYGIAVFFIATIVKAVFGLAGVDTTTGDTKICWDCATKPHNKSCLVYIDENKYNDDDNNNDNE